jgi:protease IV
MEHNIENPVWEREVLEKTLMASVIEHRRSRRWGIFFKLTFLVLFILLIAAACSDHASKPLSAHTAVIKVSGVLDSEFNTAKMINEGIRAAFEEKQVQGIILQLDSPGGSPVQANEVFDEMMRLRSLHPEKKIYAVIGDVCASGCYYIAAAADQIYANSASLVGSIGVLFDGFGFVDTLNKIGAQRRLYTAGQYKGFMDPFTPVTPEMTTMLQAMLDDIHQQFIKDVEKGRGDRLKKNDLIFSGLAWTGHQSLELGLVDNLGSVDTVARDVIGAQTQIDYTTQPGFWEQVHHQLGASFAFFLRQEVYTPKLG